MSGFFRKVNNYIQTSIAEKEGTMQYTNVPAVHVKGVEGEIRYDWQGRLQLATNVSYQDTRDQQKYKGDGKPSATYNNRVPNRPWLFGSVEAYYTFRNIALPESRLRLGCTYQWVHWYFLTWEAYGAYDNKARIPAQHILCRHTSQSLYFFRDAFQIIHLRVARFSFQDINQRRRLVANLLVALCAYHQCCCHNF
jgi:hypothetical protein